MTYCTNCGQKLEAEEKYCAKCEAEVVVDSSDNDHQTQINHLRLFMAFLAFVVVTAIVMVVVSTPFTGDPSRPNALGLIIGVVVGFFVARSVARE